MSKTKNWKELQSPLYWDNGKVVMLDQRLLPQKEIWNVYSDVENLADAIRDMVIRGAPAIGCAAAMGVAMAANSLKGKEETVKKEFDKICNTLASARPTAVNLFWAIDRQRKLFEKTISMGLKETQTALVDQAIKIWQEDIGFCRAMGKIGAELIPNGATVLTHCNAGALATGGYGTALGVIRGAVEAGKSIRVYADETRPFLQGARLTAWELLQDGIDVTVICDNQAADLFQRGEITCCVVGSDRIARNGDVANKIGTYGVAVLAHYHGVPFYVAAPTSTIDLKVIKGKDIPIEQRPQREVTHVGDTQITPSNVKIRNAAFDITPHELVTAIITERGLAKPPCENTILAFFDSKKD